MTVPATAPWRKQSGAVDEHAIQWYNLGMTSKEHQLSLLRERYFGVPQRARIKCAPLRSVTRWHPAHLAENDLLVIDTTPQRLFSNYYPGIRQLLSASEVSHFMLEEKQPEIYAYPVDEEDNRLNPDLKIDLRFRKLAQVLMGIPTYNDGFPAIIERQVTDGQSMVRFELSKYWGV